MLKIYLPHELLTKCRQEQGDFVLSVGEFGTQNQVIVRDYRKLTSTGSSSCSNLFIATAAKIRRNDDDQLKSFDLKIMIESSGETVKIESRDGRFKKCLLLIYKRKQYGLINDQKQVDSGEVGRKIAEKYQQLENNKIFRHVFANSELLSNFLALSLLLFYSFKSTERLKFTSRSTSVLFNLLIGVAVFLFLYRNHDFYRAWLNAQFSTVFEHLVNWLTRIIYWLMGVPAGLKLNKQLNEFLGRFFFYHIYLWNASIDLFNEIIPTITWLIMYIPLLGISFQLALVSDSLMLLTIHAQCFYGYARAIYKLEIDSLKSLFRLFTGKKFNPMRKRVDSYLYDIDQLFIGTLGLCIAFFLLPTVLVYYVVFLSLQLIILTVNYALKNLINFLNNLPIYDMYLTIINSTRIQKHVHYEIDKQLSSETCVICYVNFKQMKFTELLEQSECKAFKLTLPNIKESFMSILSGREIKSVSMSIM